MVKNKNKLAVKLFVIVWVVLALHVALKLTFNYWQPYVIPNDKLQAISDFVDNYKWIRTLLDCLFYTFNGVIMILSGLQIWWFKSKKQAIIVISLVVLGFIYSLIFNDSTINTILLSLILPFVLNRKKWFTILITFALTNVFLALSLWLEGFVIADDMPYIIQMFLVFDYYIMLVLSYFVFNLITFKKKVK